jgi:AcrR family transcriptional regulator/predicted DNA-binding transcriptional regulator AlpA
MMDRETGDGTEVRPLSISELERATGTPRSTIYYYVRDGLLPAAQKAAASRAVYSDVHVEALHEIRSLKNDGVPLDEIRERIRPLVERRQAGEPDLVARRTQQTRDAILQAAALQFARRGYRRTRIGDIIKEVGITPPVFYAHFNTKQQLFIEAFNVFVHWMGDLIEPPLADEPDPAVRLLMRFYAYWGLQRLSPDLLSLARAEALQEDGETREAVQEAQRWITGGPMRDLAGLRRGPDDPPVSDELMAYSLYGAGEEVFMRASWDDAYSPREILRTHLFLYLAVDAAYTGRCDTVERLKSYEPLIDRLIEQGPPVPRPRDASV